MCQTVVSYQYNLRFLLKHFLSNAWMHSSNKALSIQYFYCYLYQHGTDLTFWKHRGFLDFLITNIENFSQLAFVAATPVTLIFLCSPPLEHCQTLNGRFSLVDIDRRDRIHRRCIYPLSCPVESQLVRMFCTKMLSESVRVFTFLLFSLFFNF